MIIIDGETVITGSFNFTKAAEENNAENLLVIHDKKLAERYTKNWQEHAQHSEGYVGRGRKRERLSSLYYSIDEVSKNSVDLNLTQRKRGC